jgi:hypothetical protein
MELTIVVFERLTAVNSNSIFFRPDGRAIASTLSGGTI